MKPSVLIGDTSRCKIDNKLHSFVVGMSSLWVVNQSQHYLQGQSVI